jgi:hypothetical protein
MWFEPAAAMISFALQNLVRRAKLLVCLIILGLEVDSEIGEIANR